MVRIILIESHAAFRQALCAALETQPDFQVVSEAPTGLLGLELVEALRPDVVITAFDLPDLNGATIAQIIGRSKPESSVILFTLYDDPVYDDYARARGVRYFLSKLVHVDELFSVIRTATQRTSDHAASESQPLR